jgi:hypothetical protein
MLWERRHNKDFNDSERPSIGWVLLRAIKTTAQSRRHLLMKYMYMEHDAALIWLTSHTYCFVIMHVYVLFGGLFLASPLPLSPEYAPKYAPPPNTCSSAGPRISAA